MLRVLNLSISFFANNLSFGFYYFCTEMGTCFCLFSIFGLFIFFFF
jgi:hypothetical protein